MASIGAQFKKDADRIAYLMGQREMLLARMEVTKTGAWEVFAKLCRKEIDNLDRQATSLPPDIMGNHGRLAGALGRISGMKEVLVWFADPAASTQAKLDQVTKELDKLHKSVESKGKALGGATI